MRISLFLIALLFISGNAEAAQAKYARTYVDYCVDNSIVLCARFEENQNGKVYDESHKLTTVGAVTGANYSTGCQEGNCYDFEDATNDRIDFGDITELDGSTAISAVFWVKFDVLNTNRAFISKWGDNGGGGEQIYLFSMDGTNDDELQIAFSDGGGSTYIIRDTIDANLTTDTWYHIAFTATVNSASDSHIFVNGVEKTLTADSDTLTNLANGSTNFQIGHETDEAKDGPDGMMDEIAIFKRELTATEVLDIYENGLR